MLVILILYLHFQELIVNFTKHSSFIYYTLIDYWLGMLDTMRNS